MGLFLEPGKRVPVEVEGVTFHVRTLTAREQLRIVEHAQHVQDVGNDAEGLGHVFEILRLGIAGWDGGPKTVDDVALDTIPVHVWGDLAQKIVEVNHLSKADQGN